MRYIKTNFMSWEFNKKVEDMDLQGLEGKLIYSWILSVRLFYGIREEDMIYIFNYFMT